MKLSHSTKLFLIYALPLIPALLLPGVLFKNIGEFPPLVVSVFPLCSILLLVLTVSMPWERDEYPYHWAVSVISATMLFLSVFILYGTPTTLGGIRGDNYFSISMITKFSHSWANVDFNFKGLSSHYPFYFHYFLGKLSSALSLAPEWVFKQGALAVIYLAPVLSFWFLLKTNPLRRSFFIFLAQFASIYSTSGNFYLFQKPYELLVLFLLIPWYFFYLAGENHGFKRAAVGGVMGGLLFGTYYYWFLPLGLSLPFLLAEKRKNLRKTLPYLLVLGIFFFLASAPYTLPYLKDLVFKGMEPYSGRHLITHFYLSRMYSLLGLIYLAGLLYIIHRRVLLSLLLGTLGWLFLAYFFSLEKSPMLPHKTSPFLTLILLVGLAYLLHELSLKWKGFTRVAAVLLFLFAVNPLLYQISNVEVKERRKQIINSLVNGISWDPSLAEILKDKVVLTTYRINQSMNPFRPIYFFLPTASIFSHPSALLSQRLAFLQLLSFSENPGFVRWALVHNKFGRIDFVWPGGGRYITLLMDQFPYTYPNSFFPLKIEFSPGAFSALERTWKRRYKYLYRVKDIGLKNREKLGLLERIIYNDFTRFKDLPLKEKPLAQADEFRVYRDGKKLILIKEKCSERDLLPTFFVKYEPEGKEERIDGRRKGAFYRKKCVVVMKFPKFEFSEVRVGQEREGTVLWELRVKIPKTSGPEASPGKE